VNPVDFETLVRRAARAKWDVADADTERIGGAQIDCVARTNECIFLVEATITQSIAKVREDITKLDFARTALERDGEELVQCWQVVPSAPTPEQKATAKTKRVRIISIEDFLDDTTCRQEYMHVRNNHSFGSAADPAGDSNYTLKHFPTPIRLHPDGRQVDLAYILSRLRQGQTVVLLGDYGAGKSLTIRELFRLCDLGAEENLRAFPIAINLREHWGQPNPNEVFLRHCSNLGSDSGLRLFRAWREGFAHLLLDGFDEIAPQPWTPTRTEAQGGRSTLSRIRRAAVAAIRGLADLKPISTGLLVAGRLHYFSTVDEMLEALGLHAQSTIVVELTDLTEDQARDFLRSYGVQNVPRSWLPKRPLFLAYLARTGYISALVGLDAELDVGKAWRRLIALVCEREARISPSINAASIIDILTSLAFALRGRSDPLGPITDTDLADAFLSATSHQPDQDAWAILQRLPGLTFRAGGSSKWFVDQEWADVLGGLALANYCLGNITPRGNIRCTAPLHELGLMVAATVLEEHGHRPQDLIGWCISMNRLGIDPTTLADAVAVIVHLAADGHVFDCHGLTISGAYCGTVTVGGGSITGLNYHECSIERLVVEDVSAEGVMLDNCMIDAVLGVRNLGELSNISVDCIADKCEYPQTNADLLRGTLPTHIALAIVILRKLYVQRGHGRKLSALRRGIPPDKVSQAVRVTNELIRLGYIHGGAGAAADTVVHPVREHQDEVRRILASPPRLSEMPWSGISAS
jgi:hypothetical protein